MIEIVKDNTPKQNMYTDAVRAVIIEAGQLFLMYIPTSNTYVLPGGSVEEGEALDEALKREVLEETGYHITSYRKTLELMEYHQSITRKHTFYRVDIDTTNRQAVCLTQEEHALNMGLKKVSLKEGIRVLAEQKGTHHLSDALQLRELLGIMASIHYVKNAT